MATAIQALDVLSAELPDVFAEKELRPGWLDDWIVVPIDRPDQMTNNPNDVSSSLDSWLDEPFEDEWADHPNKSDESDVANAAEFIPPICNGLGVPGKPEFGGGPLSPWQIPMGKGVGGHPPALPPDCLAFYLPIHFYYPDWWGVYLLADGVEYFAREIWRRHTSGKIKLLTARECRAAARIYLYWHEHYHHQVECFSIRLEVTHRHALYRSGFTGFYRKTFGTKDCIEETMAEVRAYQKTLAAFLPKPGMKKREKIRQAQRQKALERALISLIKSSPSGYREAANVIKKRDGESFHQQLTERYHQAALPKAPKLSPSIWGNSPHLLHGFTNIRSRVNYLIPRHSKIAHRLPLALWPRISHRELVSGLKKLVPELQEVPARGKHPTKLKVPGGRAFPIPTHPRDLSTGTLGKIIKQAGLDMSISRFLECI